jgi:hypothetical protein
MQQTLFKNVGTYGAGLLVWAAFAATAWAGPEQGAVTATPAARADTAAAAAPARAEGAFDFGQPADLGKLEQSRGGTDTTHNTANLDGVVSGNSATNVVTGNNIIDAGAFANMSGIPVVIQNSGANVLIQSSTIVNVQFK